VFAAKTTTSGASAVAPGAVETTLGYLVLPLLLERTVNCNCPAVTPVFVMALKSWN